MIISRDLLLPLKFKFDLEKRTITFSEITIPMRNANCTKENMFIQETENIIQSTNRMKSILDAKYEKANLEEVVESCDNLSKLQKKKLLKLLQKYEKLFDGTLGIWKDETLHIELKPNVKPYHAKAFPIPKIYEKCLKAEVERLCKIGVLRKVNDSEWAAPTFIIPKKDNTVRFISDFRQLNKCLKRKPYPLPKIQDLLLKLEGFTFGTSLDLNMGYYHIRLDPDSQKLCTIILPWGKYEYLRLPMGLCNSPDVFQEKMNNLLGDLEFIRAYIDDLLILTKGNWEDHLEKLEEVFQRLQKAGLKVNIKKSFFGKDELKYLGYIITRQGIKPMKKKVEALLKIQAPKNRKELRSFIGIINFYRDMWIRRSHTLAPLTKLTSKKSKFKWTEVEQKAFDTIKKIASKETLLAYPDFNKPFEIYTDASNRQLGSVITQNKQPIAYFSRKLNQAQKNYTTTERELLAIVETLKEFRNILLGHEIKIYTDHKI